MSATEEGLLGLTPKRRIFIFDFFAEIDRIWVSTKDNFVERNKQLGPLFQTLLSLPSPVDEVFLAIHRHVWADEPAAATDEELIVVGNLIFVHALITPVPDRTPTFSAALSQVANHIFLEQCWSNLTWERYGEFGCNLHCQPNQALLDFFSADELGPVLDAILAHGLEGQLVRWSQSESFVARFRSVWDVDTMIQKLKEKLPAESLLQILKALNFQSLVGEEEDRFLWFVREVLKVDLPPKIASWLLSQLGLFKEGVSYEFFIDLFKYLKSHALDHFIPTLFSQVDWATKKMDMEFYLEDFLKEVSADESRELLKQATFLSLFGKVEWTKEKELLWLRRLLKSQSVSELQELFEQASFLEIFDKPKKLSQVLVILDLMGVKEFPGLLGPGGDARRVRSAQVFNEHSDSVKVEDYSSEYHHPVG
jgi:hypothetical protein